jgi:hypothetical protein
MPWAWAGWASSNARAVAPPARATDLAERNGVIERFGPRRRWRG